MQNVKKHTMENYNTNTYHVPLELLMDIARIVVQSEIETTIINVLENRNKIELQMRYNRELPLHQKALLNIEELLKEYEEVRFSEHETLDWKT